MKVQRINGNGNKYTLKDMKLCMAMPFMNDVALKLIKDESGLVFEKGILGYYWTTPKSAHQVLKLITRWGWKTDFYNNGSWSNTLFIHPSKE